MSDRSLHVVPSDLMPPRETGRRHLLSVTDLERHDVERLLATAHSFALSQERDTKKLPTLRGRLVVNMFFESSTRTSSSFELAAKRLSADTMSMKASGSSVEKGESLKDTALTLSAYDPDVIVIRHPQIGAPQLVAAVEVADREQMAPQLLARRQQLAWDDVQWRTHASPSSGSPMRTTRSTSSISSSCTCTRWLRAVGRFLPT